MEQIQRLLNVGLIDEAFLLFAKYSDDAILFHARFQTLKRAYSRGLVDRDTHVKQLEQFFDDFRNALKKEVS